ncbi:MAG: HAD family hydrolase [Cyanobacteria bacterium P01_D01_bin.44]
MKAPDIIAFDFDGVICDGLIEYFQTAWRAYCQLFSPANPKPPEGLAARFYKLRPVIETGWEMPMVLKAILEGYSDADIIEQWPKMAEPWLTIANLSPKDVANAVDGVRDRWIQADLDSWLGQHQFYSGLLGVLEVAISTIPTYVVSTKESRFIQKLLRQNGVDIDTEQIFGKDVKRPKYATLRQLKEKHTDNSHLPSLWFIEDRIKALQAVKQQPDLTDVELFLADWGYNLEPDRQTAREDNRIHLLSLDRVVQGFESWGDAGSD